MAKTSYLPYKALQYINKNQHFTPILNNPDFQPGLLDTGFRQWGNSGINILKDLFSDKPFMSFDQMDEKYNIPIRDFISHK